MWMADLPFDEKGNDMGNFWKTFVAVVLVILLIFGICGILYHQSGWIFKTMRQAEEQEPLALVPAAFPDVTETKAMTEWLEDRCVTFDQTLLLVNFDHPLPENYVADIEEYNGAKMHPSMIDSYIALRDEVQKRTGIRIYVSSDFRTAEEQAELVASSQQGIAAPVGCSEHEAGLSLDVYAPNHDSYAFLRSPAGRMVNEICGEYGFILRYPKGKEQITGYMYEPWHIRYLGSELAAELTENGLTVEEYFGLTSEYAETE